MYSTVCYTLYSRNVDRNRKYVNIGVGYSGLMHNCFYISLLMIISMKNTNIYKILAIMKRSEENERCPGIPVTWGEGGIRTPIFSGDLHSNVQEFWVWYGTQMGSIWNQKQFQLEPKFSDLLVQHGTKIGSTLCTPDGTPDGTLFGSIIEPMFIWTYVHWELKQFHGSNLLILVDNFFVCLFVC